MRTIIAACLAFAPSANAATLITDTDGQLIRAEGIFYLGQSIDVDFLDGSCTSLYNGCNEESDFPFTPFPNRVAIEGFAELILNDILIDSEIGLFDSMPSLIRGCEEADECQIAIPQSSLPLRASAYFIINDQSEQSDRVEFASIGPNGDTIGAPQITYAVLSATQSITQTVPLSGSLMFMALSMLPLFWSFCKRLH